MFVKQNAGICSLWVTGCLLYSSLSFGATSIGQGIYYDNQQINNLAQKYPSRVSKDAGYPLIDNYSTLKSSFRGSQFGLNTKPLTAGMRWTPLLAVDKPASQMRDSDYLTPLLMIPNPLTVSLSDGGISMGIPLQNAIVDNVHIDRGYVNTLDLTVTTGDLTGTAPLVADYSDWMVKAQWANNNNPLLSAIIAEGSPFIYVEKKNKQGLSYLRFTNSQGAQLLSNANGVSVFRTKNASDQAPRYYAYYANPNGATPTWKSAQGTVIVPVNQGGSGTVVPATSINANDTGTFFSVAAIPAANDTAAIDLANRLKANAYTFINSTQIDYDYDKASSKVITQFNFGTQQVYNNSSLSLQPAVMLYPWQIKNLNDSELANCLLQDQCASDTATIKTLKGTMHLFVPTASGQTARFSTEIPYRGVMPVLPNSLNAAQLARLDGYSFNVPADPHLDAKNPWTDTYATGKILSREAQLIKIADTLSSNSKYKTIRDNLLQQLKNQVTSFLTGLDYTTPCANGGTDCNRAQGSWFYVYNNQWNTMIGFPSGFFTATTLTDHSFHWGYLVDAAATIAQYDKKWAQQYGGMVNLLIRDIANFKYGQDSSEPTQFPHFHGFDPYAGLSSALGMPYSFDNVNEEASSEFMNLAQAIILWGTNTQGLTFEGDNTSPQDLLKTGLYLYATEGEGLNHYHFNQNPNSGVFPQGWSNTTTGQVYWLVGNVWGGKQDRSTYFCAAQPCYYQNLASNTFPITAGSLYMGISPDFVNKAYIQDAKNPCSGVASNSAYCGTLLKYYALGSPTQALQYFTQYFDQQKNIPDPGESMPSIYYWIQNLGNIGTLNTNITADTPTYAVFGSGDATYVSAYNGNNTTSTVNFYNNGTAVCSIANIPAGQIKGQLCKGGNEPPQPPNPPTKFSYMVYLGAPFNPVVINNTITCPDPVTKNPACLISSLPAPSTMTISGSNSNLCTLTINTDGTVSKVADKSKGCNINAQPATPTKPGVLNLPGGF